MVFHMPMKAFLWSIIPAVPSPGHGLTQGFIFHKLNKLITGIVQIRAVSLQAMSTWMSSKRTRSVKAWMVKAGGLTISWLNDGSEASSTRKHIWPNITISEKHGRQSVNMCTLTTLNVVILHSIIRHRHPAIIRFCYWMIMRPKGGFSPLPSYIYQFIIKSLDFFLDNWTTIPPRRSQGSFLVPAPRTGWNTPGQWFHSVPSDSVC